jgi:heme-degrading monooxygenase HmoA
MPVFIIIKRKLKIADPEKLMPLFNRLRDLAKEQPGYISGETLKSLSNPEDYMVISKWETVADWEKWFGSKVRRDVQGQIDSLIGERTFYEPFEPVSNP